MKIDIPQSGKYKLQATNTNSVEVAIIMKFLCRKLAADDKTTKRLASSLKKVGLTYFVQVCYNLIFFEPDPPHTQIIRTPAASWRDQLANCVDYTVLLGAVCHAAGMHCVIRCVNFEPSQNFTHVYPVINGVPVDLVIGQRQDGLEKKYRRQFIYDHFGKETPYFAKFDTII